ncbi:MBL fold metallo-hydrolase [Thermosphaera chiliense]|uniref:MBL fold metallo-hydrolase n=1 Tax=Thermosphaera chiliense TaxID=3402707 RepID=A0A7M1UT95_9CREN|nr:MBL fold metallo-hydrolase [Thermosphaera aggregans]QOR94362.1 MBL fold metallo-hydrolase [Thermosphaera aggregans]
MSTAYRSVGRNVYVVSGSPVTLIIKCPGANWIVDPGLLGNREKLLRNVLERLGVKEYNVLLSHTHYDHIEALEALNPSRIYVTVLEYSSLLSSMVRNILTYGFTQLPRILGVRSIDVEKEKVEIVEEGFKLGDSCGELINLSGHSPGLAGIVFEDFLFVGDAVFGDRLLSRVGIPYHFNAKRALLTLEKIKAYAEKGYSGILSHGPFANSEKLSEYVDLNAERLRLIRELVIDHLLREPLSLEELVGRILGRLGSEVSVENILLGSVTVNSIISDLQGEYGLSTEVSGGLVRYRLTRS